MRIPKRRRLEGKTDYRVRLKLLKSGLARIVFRRSNRYATGQFVKSSEAQDSVLATVDSKMLMNYGWPKEKANSLKSMPACYLSGFLLGKRIIKKYGKIEAILDIGLMRSIPKGKIYSFVKGVIDSGVKLRCNEKNFPLEERITGKKQGFGESFDKILEKIKNE